MICPQCRHENPPAQKYCGECGSPLARVRAGEPPESCLPDSRTPRRLAERILASREALEGERKQVTVLFADLKGSMELLADRDPEEARAILDPVLELMMDAVHRYDGTVNQVMGDGIMALFGAPLALEGHAVRACCAALTMQEAAKRHTGGSGSAGEQIRIGINSGEVVVRAIGSDLRMDYTAVGQTAHLAARMEQLAAPGTILLAPATRALVERHVAVKPLGPRPVKGLADPVEVCELTGMGPGGIRLRLAGQRSLTRFVGREASLERLRDLLRRTAQGRGRVAAIVAEAGLGKSRLIRELAHSGAAYGWRVLETSCVAYGKEASDPPLRDLLKIHFGVREREGHEETRARIAHRLAWLGESGASTLPALCALLEVPVHDAGWRALDAAQRGERMREAARRLVLAEARVAPVLLAVENLHCTDGETQAFLERLVEDAASTRLLLVVSYRPEYRPPWGAKADVTELRLEPLAPVAVRELLDVLLGDDASLAPVKDRLARRGNPFFLEETVRMLADSGALQGSPGHYRLRAPIHAVEIAPSVQPVLAARIDRLAPEDKHVLQIAAVVGKHVPLVLLERIARLPRDGLRRALGRLEAADFLHRTQLFPDVEYAFKHALTHEVAYGGMLHKHQRALHARIVEAIETLYAGRLDEHTNRLAHHALRGMPAGTAVRYLRKAGRRAAARSALAEARAWFEEAIRTADTLAQERAALEQALDIRLELRAVLVQLGEAQAILQRLHECEALAERLGDERRRGRIHVFMISVRAQRGELDEAVAAGERALALADPADSDELRILARSMLAPTHYFRGDYARVIELASGNLAALPEDWAHDPHGSSTPVEVFDRHWLVLSLVQLGRLAEADRHAKELLRAAETGHHTHSLLQAWHAAGTLRLFKGEWTQAAALYEQATEFIPQESLLLMLPWSVAGSAWALAQLGEASRSTGRIRQCELLLQRLAERGVLGQAGWSWQALGRAALRLGRPDEAQRFADRALEASPCHPGFAAYACHLLGDVAMHGERPDPERAEAHYLQALEIATARGMRPLLAHCHRGLGRVHLRCDRRDRAGQSLTAAAALYRGMDMRDWLEQTRRDLHAALRAV